MPREAEAMGAANGPGACELPACAGLAPVSAEVHFEGNAGECPPMAEAGEDQMNEELRLRLAAALQADDEPEPDLEPPGPATPEPDCACDASNAWLAPAKAASAKAKWYRARA